MEPTAQKISVDLIDDPAIAMRTDFDESYLDELGRSIKENGLINPISVKRVGDRFEVIAGHQRLLATRRAGLVLIDCIVRDISSEQSLIITAHENMVRQDVNPVDEAVFLGRLCTEKELSPLEVSKMLRRSEDWVLQRLEMLQWPQEVLGFVAAKQISLGAAEVLMKIPDEITRRNYIEIAAKDGITIEAARKWLSQVNIGQLGADATAEQLHAVALPEQHQETLLPCARCGQHAAMRDMYTVWVHRQCPAAE